MKGEKLSKSLWVPPPTVVRKTTTIQSNPRSLSSPSDGTRNTIHDNKANERRANLPSTITYPPSGDKDTRPYMKGCETIEDLIHIAVSHGDSIPEHLAAFWSRIPQLLLARDPSKISHD